MNEAGYGIRLKGDASGLVAESTRAEQSLAGISKAADQAGAAAKTAASAVTDLSEAVGTAATSADQLVQAETAAAAATKKTADAVSAATAATRDASRAAEVLGKSHAATAIEQQRVSGSADSLAHSHAVAAQQAGVAGQQTRSLLERIRDLFRAQADHTMAATGASAANDRLKDSSGAASNAIKLQAYQVTNLGYQLQDMAVQLAGGQSPWLVMVQQVPQAAGAVGGFGTLLRLAVSPAVLRVAGPLALMAGVLLLVGQRAASISRQTRELTQSLRAMGNVAGVSADQLRQMSIDAAADGPFTRTETYAATKGLLSHRRIAGDMVRQVMDLSVDFSAGISTDLAKGSDLLASSLERGYAGIRQLDEQFGFLTEAELRQIRTMSEHGHQAEAMQMAIDALNRRFQGAAREGMSEAAKALADVGAAWNDLLDRIANSKIVQNAAQDIDATFKWLSKQVRDDQPDIGQQVASKSKQLLDTEKRIAELQSGQGGWSALYGNRTELELREAQATVERLRKEIDDLVDRGRSQVAELEASAVKAQAQASKAAIEQSAKALGDIKDQMDKQREILSAPAPTRDLVRARQQAQDYVRDKGVEGVNPTTGKTFASEIEGQLVGGASAQIAAGARDAAVAAKLQADAQEALAKAAGQSAEAMRQAGVENKIAAFAYQYAGAGVKEYAAQAWRAYEAEEAMRRAEWTRQVNQQVAANDNLAKAYRSGSTAALDSAERENEIRDVMERTGAAYDQAAQGIDRLRASRKALDAERALTSLKRDIEDAEALTGSLRTADPAATRRAQIDAQARRFANDNRLSDNDNQVAEFRSLKEREYADQVKRSAVETNRAQDATFRYREAMAQLNEQRASGVLTEEAYTEQWKRLEREKLEASKDFADGAKRALWDYAEEAGNAAKRAERLFSNAFRSMEDALVSFARAGKLDFAALADSIISDMIRMQVQAQITAPLAGMMNSWLGGLGSLWGGNSSTGVGSLTGEHLGTGTAVYHAGGVVGAGSQVQRHIDQGIFSTATRYHIGGVVGLRPGEVPIIANRNEEVLTEDNPRHIFNLGRGAAGGGGGGTAVNLDVQVIDQRSSDSPPVQISQQRGPDGGTLLRVLIPAIRKDLAQRGDLSQSFEGAFDIRRRVGR